MNFNRSTSVGLLHQSVKENHGGTVYASGRLCGHGAFLFVWYLLENNAPSTNIIYVAAE